MQTIRPDIIKKSWQMMVSKNGTFNAMLFYNNLFEAEPAIRSLFPPNIERLSKKFTYTMDELVDGCDKLDDPKTQEMLKDLGGMHKKLNVQDRHYDLISNTIIKTVKQSLASKYTDEIGAEWERLISIVSHHMKLAPERKVNKLQQLLEKLFGKNQ